MCVAIDQLESIWPSPDGSGNLFEVGPVTINPSGIFSLRREPKRVTFSLRKSFELAKT
jgi:hypothetical protein